MRHAMVAGFLLALGVSWASAAPPAPDPFASVRMVRLSGQPAPPLALPTLDGRRFSLAELKGRPALVYFWATW